jgi:hypothetical protein
MEFALIALLCPIGMGLMMWFMAKGMRMGRREGDASSKDIAPPTADELRAEQERLAAKLSELERDKARSAV